MNYFISNTKIKLLVFLNTQLEIIETCNSITETS